LKRFLFNNPPRKKHFAISIFAVCVVALTGSALDGILGYRYVAFMLLVTVSILAMFLDLYPLLLAAVMSALIWDYFFIPPKFTVTIGHDEDRLLLLMYFIIVMINAVLTFKITKIQRQVREKEGKAREVKFYNTLFNSLSHELRTPITTIIGTTDNLSHKGHRLKEETRRELLHEISIAALRLNQQVENLLNMSRLESGVFKIKKDWVDVNELIYKVVHLLEPHLHNFRTSINVPEGLPLVKLDFGIMEQVLYNLIYNAVIHTPTQTTITVQATYLDKLIITVADNGQGFPEGEFENVFTKFYQLPGSKSTSTGLGLSIVKGFVEAHNGTIRLENLPVCGAKFTIEIDTQVSFPKKINEPSS
jgi:two-component system, OmpR family, sensor histidine kinase KdpD